MTGPDKPHLFQHDLGDIDGINSQFIRLNEFLETAKFEGGRKNSEENCADDDLPKYADPFLEKAGFQKVVSICEPYLSVTDKVSGETQKVQCGQDSRPAYGAIQIEICGHHTFTGVGNDLSDA
jgi:hypothetical protein